MSSASSPDSLLPEMPSDDSAVLAPESSENSEASAAPQHQERVQARSWWQTRRATALALVLVLLLGAYFRLLNLAEWDSGVLLHPDERFFTDVSSLVRTPTSLEEYFDAARSPANPRNIGKTFFVYGSFPVTLTRFVAVVLTPPEALPETVPEITGLPGDDASPTMIPNPEREIPRFMPLIDWLNPEGLNLTGYGQIQVVGRSLVVLFDMGSLLLVFLIAARLFDRRVALLAALLAALTVMSIQQSHFYVDPIFSTFFTLLALYWAVRVAQGGGAWTYVVLGFAIGCAAASRITLVMLALVAIVAAVQAALIRRERALVANHDAKRRFVLVDDLTGRTLLLLTLAGVATIVTFRLLHPYVFVGSQPDSPPIAHHENVATTDHFMHGWGIFDIRPSPRFLANTSEVGRMVSGETDMYPSQQWVNRIDHFYPWVNMVVWGMGPALGALVWIGWAVAGWWLLRRFPAVLRGQAAARELAPFVLWFWVAFYFGWQGGQFVSTLRYLLPIYGALTILGAWLLIRLWDRASASRARVCASLVGSFFAGRWHLAAGRWLLLVVVLGTLGWAYAFSRIYIRDHSRVQAAQWLVQHAPPGSKIAAEHWDDALPLQVTTTGMNPFSTIYRGVETRLYWEDEPQKYVSSAGTQGLLDGLEEADYITLTSNRVYDSVVRLPMRYPAAMRYYHLLFTEQLGFELAAEITSYPELFGVSIPDHMAEEAFTVYDHPRVLIFRKTPEFSRERAEELLLERINWDEVHKAPVSAADLAPTALRFTESEWPHYRQGGTWTARWNPHSIVNQDAVAPLLWLLVLQVLGLAMFALLFRLLPWLPDRGWSLARALGLLVVAYAAWLLGSLHLLPFAPLTVWLCALPLLAGGAWAAWRSRVALRAFWRERRGALLTAEAIYLMAFAAMLTVRWLNPELWQPARGGEKPMDMAYLNAVLQSAAFPPYDPWFAGGYINYYYFGFVIVGTLVHMTTIVPTIAYNLAVPALFALTAVGAWGVVYNLLAPRSPMHAASRPATSPQTAPPPDVEDEAEDVTEPFFFAPVLEGEGDASPEPDTPDRDEQTSAPAAQPVVARRWWAIVERRARIAALLAPLFVLLLGNLAQAVWYLNGYAAANAHRPEWRFWDATRIVEGTVNEFPFFTFLFADLHAHMIVMPFSLAVLGLLVALARRGRGQWALIGLLGLLGGTLSATNTWDYPTYMGLTVVTLGLLGWWQFRRERRHMPADSAPVEWWLLAGRRALVTLVQVVLVIGLGNLLFLPFSSHFATASSGVDVWREGLSEGALAQILDAPRTTLWETVRLFGLWLFLLASAGVLLAHRLWVRSSSGRAGVANVVVRVGVVLVVFLALGSLFLLRFEGLNTLSAPWLLFPLLLGAGGLALALRRVAPRKQLPLLWAATALALALGIEFFVVRGDVGRMNTVFKFGLHAWTLFALTAAVALPWMWRELRSRASGRAGPLAWAWRAAAVLLIAAGLVYPLTATSARIQDKYAQDAPNTLNGALFMRFVEAGENGVNFPLSEDYVAIGWMQRYIEGTPMILEAHLPSYRWGGRVSIYTGLPTLLGWEWHQIQQRSVAHTPPVIQNRKATIEEIYSGIDAARAMELLRLYGVEYVYVGGIERAIYAPGGIAKFDYLAETGELEEVFRNGQTQIFRVTAPGAPTVLTSDIPVVPPSDNTFPPLMLDQPVDELPAVDEYAWNAWASASSWSALLVWLLVLYVLPLFGLPVAVLLFGGWRDAGMVWARPLGWLLVGYVIWLPAGLGLWHYNLLSVGIGMALVVVLNMALLAWMGRRIQAARAADAASGTPAERHPPALLTGLAFVGRRLVACRWQVLMSEVVFLAGFLLLVGLRALNPDLWHPIWGGEKPMEFGFLNAILRSPVMPPYDPFFSGGYINYYYYGFYLVSLPIKLTGIDPALAYNLALPTLFGLVLAGGYAVVAQITRSVRYGLVGAAFLAILGNLASAFAAPRGFARGWRSVLNHLQTGGLDELGARLGDWYVYPSRVIPFTINEFPAWSFLYADLHPHMIALPVALLVVALAYEYVRRHMGRAAPADLPPDYAALLAGRAGATSWYLAAALALGALAVINSWDFPTYMLLVGAVVVGAALRIAGSGVLRWLHLGRAALLAVVLALGALALYMPFFDYYHAPVSGLGLVRAGTHIYDYLLIYGLFIAVLLPLLLGVLWRVLRVQIRRATAYGSLLRGVPLLLCVLLPLLLTVVGVLRPVPGLSFWLAALLGLGLVLFVQRRIAAPLWFALLLATVAWTVTLGSELVFIRDHLAQDNYYRMNTVFKFGFQAYTLLALAAAAALPFWLRGLGWLGLRLNTGRRAMQGVGLAGLAVLVSAATMFPLFGVPSRLANRFDTPPPPTLDGLAFLHSAEFLYDCAAWSGCAHDAATVTIDLAPDADAIAWLNEQMHGTPVVLQATQWFYRAYGVRVAANTGLPTVTSALHVDEQRDPYLAAKRIQEVDQMYRISDVETTLRLLAKYDVDYIYVGPVEQALYNSAGLQKFERMDGTYLQTAYTAPGVTIYAVEDIPPEFTAPQPVVFEEDTPAPAPPEEPVLPEEPLPEGPPLEQLEAQWSADPGNAAIAYALAERYRDNDQVYDAIRVLELAAAANPDDVGLHHLWGDMLMLVQQYDEAEQVYRAIAEEVPTAGNWNKLGTSLLQWGELERAEEALQLAVAADPTEPEPYFRLGELYFRQGEREQAIAELEAYLERDPDGYLSGEAQALLNDLR